MHGMLVPLLMNRYCCIVEYQLKMIFILHFDHKSEDMSMIYHVLEHNHIEK